MVVAAEGEGGIVDLLLFKGWTRKDELSTYISAVAGTDMDLDRELEAASVEHLIASDGEIETP